MAGDPNFNDVSLLLHCDGADESTSFPDSSNNELTVTAVGAAQVDTAQSKFGGASLLLASSDRLALPNNALLDMGAGDFTVECFFRTGSDTNQTLFVLSEAASSGYAGLRMQVSNTGRATLLVSATGSSWALTPNSANGVWSLNTWHHAAITRSGNDFKFFIDGVVVITASSSVTLYSSGSVYAIGYLPNLENVPFIGHIDEARITKGVARYTANFTPPTAPFPDTQASVEITSQPVNDSVVVGQTASFTVVAEGGEGTILYQWKRGEDDSDVVGETSATYDFVPVLEDSGKTFYVTVSDDINSVDSDTVTLTVSPAMSILTQPTNQTAEIGEEATFSVAIQDANGTVSYQWYEVVDGSPVELVGETSSSLVFTATEAEYNSYYFVEIDDTITFLTSNVVALVVAIPKEYGLDLGGQRGPIYRRGTIVLDSPISGAEGTGLLIRRKTPITNDFLAEAFLPFQPEQFEHQVDRYIMILQEIEGDACACPPTYTIPDSIDPGAFDDIDEEFPPECYPYVCSAFEDAALELGGSYWPLDDPTHSDLRPSTYRKIDTNDDLGYALKFAPDVSGSGWGGTVTKRTIGNEIDLCGGPIDIVLRANTGSETPPFGFYITPNPWVALSAPSVNFSCVAIGAQSGNLVYSQAAKLDFTAGTSGTISSRFQFNLGRGGSPGAYTYSIDIGFGNGAFPFKNIALPDNLFDDNQAHFLSISSTLGYRTEFSGGSHRLFFTMVYEIHVDEFELIGSEESQGASNSSNAYTGIEWDLTAFSDEATVRFMERSPEMAWYGFSWGTGDGQARADMYNSFLRNFTGYEPPEYCST